MKRYLISMSVLLILALVAGVGVWFLYQDMNVEELLKEEGKEAELFTPSEEESLEAIAEQKNEGSEEPVSITAGSLSDVQRSMLESLGYGGAEFTITEGMIACAKAEVGEERLREIIDGAAPSPMEAFSLVPCMKAP